MKNALLILSVILAIWYVGNEDLKDAEQDDAVYCDNVYNERWPDFKENYTLVCENDEVKKDSK